MHRKLARKIFKFNSSSLIFHFYMESVEWDVTLSDEF